MILENITVFAWFNLAVTLNSWFQEFKFCSLFFVSYFQWTEKDIGFPLSFHLIQGLLIGKIESTIKQWVCRASMSPHTCLVPRTLVNSRNGESPAILQEIGFRTQCYAYGWAQLLLVLLHLPTSSSYFHAKEVTFYIPGACLSTMGDSPATRHLPLSFRSDQPVNNNGK